MATQHSEAAQTDADTDREVLGVIEGDNSLDQQDDGVADAASVDGPLDFGVAVDDLTIEATPAADASPGVWAFRVKPKEAELEQLFRFVWDFGDGVQEEGVEITHTFTSAGTFVVTVTASTNRGDVAFTLTLQITVDLPEPANRVPFADAGPNQTVDEQAEVELDGSGSGDPDGDALDAEWRQVAGIPVVLSDPHALVTGFVAPEVEADERLAFSLVVSDGLVTASDVVEVLVQDLVQAASVDVFADAGADLLVTTGAEITLDGSNSTVLGGATPSYQWSQTAGLTVELAGADAAQATFVAPFVAAGAETLTFVLTVSAGGAQDSDDVLVTVNAETGGGGGGGPPPGDNCDPTIDSDGDGVSDCTDQCPGFDDALDDDGDGVANGCDACPNDPNKVNPDVCGCGVADADSNGDGVIDCQQPGIGTLLTASFSSVPVLVDGVLDPGEWSGANTYSMDAGDRAFPGIVVEGVTTGTSDTSATIWLKHDASYVYVAAVVQDDNVVESAAQLWQADVVELFMDVDNSDTPSVGFNRFQLLVNAGGAFGEADAVPAGSWSGAAGVSGGGYVVEFRIDKNAVGLVSGNTYGFDLAISDVEPTGGVIETRYWYFSPTAGETNESLWGDIELEDPCMSGPDSDGDGIPDCSDQCPGFDDALDDDGDGMPNGCDGCPADPAKADPGDCGCGIADTDCNNDGITDCQQPATLDVTYAGQPGCLDFGPTGTCASVQVCNQGGGSLPYTVNDDAAWLTLSPTSGDLSSCQCDTITACVDRAGLPDGTYQANITVMPNIGSSIAICVAMAVQPAGNLPAPVIIASRTQGMTPLAIFFEGTESTDANGKKIGDSNGGDGLLGNDLVEYTWDFGDGTTFSGFNAAHVYEPPGSPGPNGEPSGAGATYTVTLTVRDKNNQTASSTQPITVNPFSGTTYYVRADGSDANAGTGPDTGQAWQSYNKAFNAMRNKNIVQPGDRVLFNRGDTFPYSSKVGLGGATNVLLAAYGNGALPKIQYTGGAIDEEALSRGHAISVADLHIHANDAANGFSGSDNLLLLRTLVEHYIQILCSADGVFIVESVLTNADLMNLFYNGSRLAILNSTIGPARRSHNLYGSVIDRGVISGNTFRSPNGGRHNLRIAPNTGNSGQIVVSDNEFDGGGTWLSVHLGESAGGIVPYRAHNILFERNFFHDATIFIGNDNDGYTDIAIRNNVFVQGTALALRDDSSLRVGTRGLQFHCNTVYSPGSAALLRIDTTDHQDIEIFNNIITGTGDSSNDILIVGGLDEVFLSNNFFGDPGFTTPNPTRPEHFPLVDGSPAINAGTELPVVYEDFNQARRPARPGGAWDIGAFEHP